MGFDALSTSRVTTVFTNMFNQGVVSANIFSFWFNRYCNNQVYTKRNLNYFYIVKIWRDTTSLSGGELLLGGINPTYYTGNISYVPVIRQAFWQIKITGYIENKHIRSLNEISQKLIQKFIIKHNYK